MRYKTPAAFRRALSDRLNYQARVKGVDVARLMKQLAFERFLARLFHTGSPRWVLKGGYALELRLGKRARATQDLDLNVPPPLMADPLKELQQAAELDLGDFLVFRVEQGRGALIGPPLGGYRFHVEARLDGRVFTRFPLDLGRGDVLTSQPQWLRGQLDLGFADIPTPTFAAYPLEDHFAEKLHAYTKPRELPTRVKDLVDMLLLIDLGLVVSPLLRNAISLTFERYSTHLLPQRLPTPPQTWVPSFTELTNEVGLQPVSLAEAYEHLVGFLDGVVEG